jgi:anthranilate phosphoribosyltransferase
MITDAIDKLVRSESLDNAEASSAMEEIMDGTATQAQISAFLVALRMKGETIEEIAGLAHVMRDRAIRVELGDTRVVDTCGTGGDRSGTFNISTTAALVASAAGVPIAKHGNRAMSSRCGSADVLEALGVEINLDAEGVARCVRYAGIGFMFAPLFHPAMKHAAPVRRELGTRTVFNILGPLTNPARARRQVLGVAHESLVPKMAGALERLETQHALVAHGHGGLDELSVTGPSVIYRVRAGRPVERIEVLPQDFDFEPASMEAIAGGTAVENAAMIRNVLAGEHGPRRDVVLLNAAAALLVADAVTTLQEGIKVAARAIDSGAGMDTLANLVEASRNPGISGVAPRAKTTRTKRGRAA